jgi:hypothetical protein
MLYEDYGMLFASNHAVRNTRISYAVTIMLVCCDDSQRKTYNLTYLLLLSYFPEPNLTTWNCNFPLTRSKYLLFDLFTPH